MKKIFYGWFAVCGGFLVIGVLHSMMNTCFGIFIIPITTDLNINRTNFGICNSIIMIITMLLSPYMGRILSGKHTTRIFCTCILGMSVSFASYSLMKNAYHMYISAAFVGIFSCGAVSLPVSIIITNWFVKFRGAAISVAFAGSGLLGAGINPIIVSCIMKYGWRMTLVISAIFIAIVGFPSALYLMRPRPDTMNLQPYGFDDSKNAIHQPTKIHIPLSQLKKYPFFWMYFISMILIGMIGYGSLGQIVPYLTDIYGISLCTQLISFFLVLVTPAKIILGILYDKIGYNKGTIVIMVFFAASLAMFLVTESKQVAFINMVLYAVGICCYTIIPPICTAALFGSKYYGEIYGFINFGVMAGGAIGSPAVASIYDGTHSYELAWIACILACALGTILILLSDYMFKHFLRKMDVEHVQA